LKKKSKVYLIAFCSRSFEADLQNRNVEIRYTGIKLISLNTFPFAAAFLEMRSFYFVQSKLDQEKLA
jgi:hypothetical protein